MAGWINELLATPTKWGLTKENLNPNIIPPGTQIVNQNPFGFDRANNAPYYPSESDLARWISAMMSEPDGPNNKATSKTEIDPVMAELEKRQKINDVKKQEMEIHAQQSQMTPPQPVTTPESITNGLNKDGIIDHGPDVAKFFNDLVGGIRDFIQPYNTVNTPYGKVEEPSAWLNFLRAFSASQAPGASKVMEADVASKESQQKVNRELLVKLMEKQQKKLSTTLMGPNGEQIWEDPIKGFVDSFGNSVDSRTLKKVAASETVRNPINAVTTLGHEVVAQAVEGGLEIDGKVYPLSNFKSVGGTPISKSEELSNLTFERQLKLLNVRKEIKESQEFKTVATALSYIDHNLNKLDETMGKIWSGRAGGSVAGALSVVIPNKAIAEYDALKAGTLTNLARTFGEKGVISDTDIKRIDAGFPRITDSKQERAAKISIIRGIINSAIVTKAALMGKTPAEYLISVGLATPQAETDGWTPEKEARYQELLKKQGGK